MRLKHLKSHFFIHKSILNSSERWAASYKHTRCWHRQLKEIQFQGWLGFNFHFSLLKSTEEPHFRKHIRTTRRKTISNSKHISDNCRPILCCYWWNATQILHAKDFVWSWNLNLESHSTQGKMKSSYKDDHSPTLKLHLISGSAGKWSDTTYAHGVSMVGKWACNLSF